MRRLGAPSGYSEARQSSPSLSPRTILRPTVSEDGASHKRIRVGYEGYSPVASEPLPLPQPGGVHKQSMGWHPRPIELPRIHEDAINRTWRS